MSRPAKTAAVKTGLNVVIANLLRIGLLLAVFLLIVGVVLAALGHGRRFPRANVYQRYTARSPSRGGRVLLSRSARAADHAGAARVSPCCRLRPAIVPGCFASFSLLVLVVAGPDGVLGVSG